MDIGRILLILAGIFYCAYKIYHGGKSKYLFFLMLFIYSFTSQSFIINPNSFPSLVSFFDNSIFSMINALLCLIMVILLGNMAFIKFKATRQKI